MKGWFLIKKLINILHKSVFLGRIFHTLNYCIQRELNDCTTVLDLGCGPSSPIQYCNNINYSLGVEAFTPYLEESQKKKIHTEYLNKTIESLDFPENSFDAVLIVEVLEHLPEKIGVEILKKAEKWAKKKILISTPNGFFPMGSVDDNLFQRHLSGWNINKLNRYGYKCFGLSGAKFFYLEQNTVGSLKDASLYQNIRFSPKIFFYFLNALSCIVTYFIPKFAFGLFAIKENHQDAI